MAKSINTKLTDHKKHLTIQSQCHMIKQSWTDSNTELSSETKGTEKSCFVNKKFT